MNRRDRTFLTELTQFTYKNHVASVYIYRSRLNSLEAMEDVAVFAENEFRHYASREAALEDVRKYNDAKGIERIICARILAEYVSACEDLGALGDAIRYGKKSGIFQRYLSSSPGQAADFFDKCVLSHDVLNDTDLTIAPILDLPDIAVLAGRVSQEDYAEFRLSFRHQAINLYAAAKTYREMGSHVRTVNHGGVMASNEDDELHIILDIMPVGVVSTKKGGLFARALNKIKHRFTVTDRLRDYAEPSALDKIEYAVLKPEDIDMIVDSTVAVAGTMAELAAFLLHIDAAGVVV